jgi:hypothetical protein
MKKKALKAPLQVTIVGGATVNQQAVLMREGEIWCLNAHRPGWLSPTMIARCFNLHRYKHLRRDWHSGVYAEAEWANRYPEIQFVVCDRWPSALLPNQVLLPRAELETMPNGKYHSSSIDWMVAWATLLGAKQINVHGVNFGPAEESGEPISARACLEYWLGYAQGAGVKVQVARDCLSLFKQFHYVRSDSSYGFDDVRMIEARA